MATKNLSAIRSTIRQFLSDEFSASTDQDFDDDELEIHIASCLTEISERRPYEVKVTTDDDGTALVTTAASLELDISNIADVIKVLCAEFPVGNEPPDYRNVSVFGNTLRFAYDSSPAADQAIYLYCHKYHQLTESTSTLDQRLERVLVLGVCAKAAIAKSKTLINTVPVGGMRTASEMQAWGVNKLALYERDLRLITKQRRAQLYPTS